MKKLNSFYRILGARADLLERAHPRRAQWHRLGKPRKYAGVRNAINGKLPLTDPEVEFSFWDKVKKTSENGCWEWIAGRAHFGYGSFSVRRVKVKAHRFSYALRFGKIPEGMRVCHRCDNPPCVNPDHLFLGTDKDNMRDCISKGRLRPGASTRHAEAKFTAEQVREFRSEYERIKSLPRGGYGHIASLYAKFGVAYNTAVACAKRKSYKDIE